MLLLNSSILATTIFDVEIAPSEMSGADEAAMLLECVCPSKPSRPILSKDLTEELKAEAKYLQSVGKFTFLWIDNLR